MKSNITITKEELAVMFKNQLPDLNTEKFSGLILLKGGKTLFKATKNITTAIIPNSVTRIGDSAFLGCGSLTSVTIPDGVKEIDVWAFYECKSLTSINIPNSVTRISNYAFYGCTSLTSIIIPNSVNKIGWHVFMGCKSLVVFTDNDYVINYCNKHNIKVKPLNNKIK